MDCPTNSSLAVSNKEDKMKKEKEDRKISVRLSDEAYKKVIDAVNGGISKSK